MRRHGHQRTSTASVSPGTKVQAQRRLRSFAFTSTLPDVVSFPDVDGPVLGLVEVPVVSHGVIAGTRARPGP